MHGDLAVALRLLDVIGDERLQRGVPVLLELALDEVGAAAAAGWVVGDADDAVDALAVEDAFAGGDGVAGEFDAFADTVAVADELGDGRGGHERSFQVAVDPKPATSSGRTAAASSGPRAIASAMSLRSIERSVRVLDLRLFESLDLAAGFAAGARVGECLAGPAGERSQVRELPAGGPVDQLGGAGHRGLLVVGVGGHAPARPRSVQAVKPMIRTLVVPPAAGRWGCHRLDGRRRAWQAFGGLARSPALRTGRSYSTSDESSSACSAGASSTASSIREASRSISAAVCSSTPRSACSAHDAR